ncbi:MAG: acetate/propionate family kinase [Gammaproteobacteria bacterium]|nr:acetate/propionate family kinase [Gammaproteobacteria bacterium]
MSPTASNIILVLNCGSSSIKFALFDADVLPLPRTPLWKGQVLGIGGPAPAFADGSDAPPRRIGLDHEHPHTAALALIQQQVAGWLAGRRLAAVAHRVVHGGNQYFEPVIVDAATIAELRALIPLAPLHQPFPLKAMSLLREQQPGVLQVACFDTAFHRSLPMAEQMLPLPHAAWERGLRRYGFHGLSYQYMSEVLPERHGELARGRVIVAHLGSGASLCAMQGLESRATTMGFSALDGLMMGTRSGSIDPGVLLHLMAVDGLSVERLGRMLYEESGMLGISGISAEPRLLVQHEGDPGEAGERARTALDLYVHRIVREIGALVALLGGLELLVFTAGIGENNAFVRERVCHRLGFLGIRLDAAANAIHAQTISQTDSRVRVAVEPTNEEWVAAQAARRLLQQTPSPSSR